MKKFFSLFFIFGFLLMLNGCFDDIPSENDGRKAFKSMISSKAKILSFKKTNGKKYEFGGAKYYEMFYEAEIVYPEGLNTQCLEKNLPTVYAFGKPIGKDRSRCIGLFGIKTRDIGEKEKLSGSIAFEKTENGWIRSR